MQAIVETLFDAVYLISVITIGVLMIRGSKGNRQFRLFGWMAVAGRRRFLSSDPPGSGSMYHRSGELHRPPGAGQMDHLNHHDRFLCAALLRVAAAV